LDPFERMKLFDSKKKGFRGKLPKKGKDPFETTEDRKLKKKKY
jgi:hypothetical protein